MIDTPRKGGIPWWIFLLIFGVVFFVAVGYLILQLQLGLVIQPDPDLPAIRARDEGGSCLISTWIGGKYVFKSIPGDCDAAALNEFWERVKNDPEYQDLDPTILERLKEATKNFPWPK